MKARLRQPTTTRTRKETPTIACLSARPWILSAGAVAANPHSACNNYLSAHVLKCHFSDSGRRFPRSLERHESQRLSFTERRVTR